MSDREPASSARVPFRHRATAWLSFKLGKRPSDSLLDYCAQWAATPSLRSEAARLLAKRKAGADG
jgi:hypothetical protein